MSKAGTTVFHQMHKTRKIAASFYNIETWHRKLKTVIIFLNRVNHHFDRGTLNLVFEIDETKTRS